MKNGFTLMELLAVIVILAVIVTIAAPIVLDVITDSKASARLRSVEYYLKAVEQEILENEIDNTGTFNPGTCIIQKDGSLLCDGKDVVKIDTSGTPPTSGVLVFEDQKIKDVLLNVGDQVIKRDKDNKLILASTVLSDYIKNLYKPTTTTTLNNIVYSLDEKHELMNDRLGDASASAADGNIRYYGPNPNNYIDIGDRDSDGNIIFWRIIGLFHDVEVTDEFGEVIKTEDLVKIIRADSLSAGDTNSFSWDYTSTGEYDNKWSNSTLQIMLNDGYYNSSTTQYYNNNTTPTMLDFYSEGLSPETYNLIEKVQWNTDGHTTFQIYADEMYNFERQGNNVWPAKVGLVYMSDYVYAFDLTKCQNNIYNSVTTSVCKNANWMYDSSNFQWTLTPITKNTINVYDIPNTFFTTGHNSLNNTYAIRPVLYLKFNAVVAEEKKTETGMKYLVIK